MNEAKDGCKIEGCQGKFVEADGGCLAHTSPELRQARLKELHNGGKLDARGIPIGTELLEEILNAAPRDEDGYPHLRHANFSYARFNGPAYLGDTRFDEGADFENACFNEEANFGVLSSARWPTSSRLSSAAGLISTRFSSTVLSASSNKLRLAASPFSTTRSSMARPFPGR